MLFKLSGEQSSRRVVVVEDPCRVGPGVKDLHRIVDASEGVVEEPGPALLPSAAVAKALERK